MMVDYIVGLMICYVAGIITFLAWSRIVRETKR